MDPFGTGPAPRILGLTGPIACGKTTVGGILLQLGATERIDADQVVHELMRPGTPTTIRIREAFGPDVIMPDDAVDRAALGRTVFADPGALKVLEEITHPAVRAAIRKKIADFNRCNGVIVVEAVKLLQSDLLPLCDAVWLVRCDRDEQERRLAENRGMNVAETRGRLSAQPSFSHPAVTTVIDNSGSLEDLRAAVNAAWRDVLEAWGLTVSAKEPNPR